MKQRPTQNPHKYSEVHKTMNQQQCKILYDFGGHLENMQISSIRRNFSACKH